MNTGIHRFLRVMAALIVIGCALAATAPPAHGQADDPVGDEPVGDEPGKVLLFTVPGLTWKDVQTHDLPVIEEFLAAAAVANHAPRGARVRTDPGGGYLSIGSGGRAIGHGSTDGQVLAVDDPAAGTPAGEIFERRTGMPPDADWVLLNWPDLVERNDAQPYDVELGSLVGALGDIGLEVAAIGNADGADTLQTTYEREVGLAAADENGAVAHGRFGTDLIIDGPEAAGRPFGRQMNTEKYLEGFRELWNLDDMGLVVAEASDAARTLRYRDRVDTDRYRELWDLALTEADTLFGRLLEHVDPARDTVILLAPYNLRGDRDLTVAAMADPARTSEPGGYLRTASTQRSGYVMLADVAPTVLEILGADAPASMEGRPFVVTASSDTVAERIDTLVSGNDASRFRENLLVPTTVLIVVGIGIVCAVAIACLAHGRAPEWLTGVVSTAALAVMTMFPMSFVARAFTLEDLGMGFYWSFVIGTSVLIAAVLAVVAHRLARPRVALLGALAVVVGVIGVDVMTGSRLEMSAAFGYSPTGNARLYGISNYALGAFGAAASLLSAFVASRRDLPARRGLATATMILALAIIGIPVWGANVGGILSFTPVVVLFVAMILGDRVRLGRLAVGFAVITFVAIAVFAALDLSRPADERAHLGRLVERIGDEGIGVLWGFVSRKGIAAIEVTLSSFWTLSAVIGIIFLFYLRRLPWRPVRRLAVGIEYVTAGVAAGCAAAFFGSTFNDSGGIVGGTAMLVVSASLVWLTLQPVDDVAPVADGDDGS